ncbi:conserved hypothetical protein [Hyella patelloides LEGE 07179]|uniref:Uncharacterized protein n=1 Tax=Hyella patelloides LEGE 07179 TaxID=945734 RepID=A0A563VXY6_9CYAN|nr:hypothetical protein [Hyella patelloides]VEP16275.1 conserved hypothetical protein [Hyella patelloides LEGE 07179]
MLVNKQINLDVISCLLNEVLKSEGVTAKKVSFKNDYLQILLEADNIPDREKCISFISKQLIQLNIESIVKVYGKQKEEDFPEWVVELSIEIQSQANIAELAQKRNIEAIIDLVSNNLDIESINVKASWKNDCLQLVLFSSQKIDQELATTIKNNIFDLKIEECNKLKIYSQQIDDDFPDWMKEFEIEQVNALEKTIKESLQITENKDNLFSIWNSFTQTITTAGENVSNSITYAGQSAVETITWASSTVGETVLKATDGVGYLFEIVQNSPQLNELTKTLKVDWIVQIIDKVDVVKAEVEVQELQSKYTHENPSEIAHRIITSKAMYAGGAGLASSLLPGFAAAMFTVDLTANMLLQAEMVYQIACAYGLDIKDSARKGEVLAIFGLSLGGSQILKSGSQYALKAGLGFLRNIPAAGAAIGASTNALMIYSLGYGACRFYEAKATNVTMEATLEDIQKENNSYLEKAIEQEVIIDQILVHVVVAGNPDKNWQTIMPELKSLNLSPASLETISKNIKSPPSLEELLERLNQDFAISLLAQCQKVANLDGVINIEEAKIIAKIARKIDID